MKYPFPAADADLRDLRAAVTKYILPGYIPEAPFLPHTARALTMGSCFATTINDALVNRGVRSAHISVAESINTPVFTNLLVQQLLGADVSALADLGNEIMPPDAREPLLERMNHASLFIVTVGVALQPFHKDGRPTFNKRRMAEGKAVVEGSNWRMLSVAEISSYLRSIISGLRTINSGATVVLTLSPIPLSNSMRHPSVFGQDCISKSNLRASIAEVLGDATRNVFYWPSFEIVRWLGGHVGPFFGTEGQDQRHVAASCIDVITQLFIEHYFRGN